ncbi:hypothetical protein [Streptomyces sp. NBC_01431]|uniref:hypothetical protein n=1 Tax=Streptomyces sp. NBC_01431 TaxID=2903863 RepID=UPI002E365B4F|nr:hypothetical protein [Streptomyces sp. NBC_01431]
METEAIDAVSRLAIHLAGEHETDAHIGLTLIPLLKIPTAIIEFRHPIAARVWWEGWCEASELLDRIFPEQVHAGELRAPSLAINSFVILDDAPRRAKVRGRSATVSPDGIGALSVTVEGLTIVCASRRAVECQVRGWREAYGVIASDGGFGLPCADEVARRVHADQARHGANELLAATTEQTVRRISQGQQVQVQRRPSRGQPVRPEVWEGRVLQVVYADRELTDIEIYGRRASTGEVRRVAFSLTDDELFRTNVRPVESS